MAGKGRLEVSDHPGLKPSRPRQKFNPHPESSVAVPRSRPRLSTKRVIEAERSKRESRREIAYLVIRTCARRNGAVTHTLSMSM